MSHKQKFKKDNTLRKISKNLDEKKPQVNFLLYFDGQVFKTVNNIFADKVYL
jgi:hypothetical protein